MALGDIVVSLNLDDSGFTRKIRLSERELRRFGTALGITNVGVQRTERRFRSFGRTLRDTFIVLGLARSALANVTAVLGAMPNAIIKANANLEQMQFLIAGLDAEATSMGDAMNRATGTINDLFAASSSSPFAIAEVTNSFVKMKSAGIDPLDGSLQALLDGVAKFGGSNQQLARASIAIQQMAGKGVISMEELRQQLGEAIPNAMAVMSRATGLEMSKMVEIISNGQLEANSALQLFFRQLEIESGGSAERLSNTWNGLVNRLVNAWTKFLKRVGDTGAFQALKAEFQTFVELLEAGEFDDWAITIGEFIKTTIAVIKEAIVFAREWKEEIILLVKVFVGLKVVLPVITGISSSLKQAALDSAKFAANQKLVTNSLNLSLLNTYSGGLREKTKASIAARSAAGGLARGIASVGMAVSRVLPVIGAIAAAYWGAVEAHKWWNRESIKAKELREQGEPITDSTQIDLLKRQNEQMRAELAEKRVILEEQKAAFEEAQQIMQGTSGVPLGRGARRLARDQVESYNEIQKSYEKMAQTIAENSELIRKSQERAFDLNVSELVAQNAQDVSDQLGVLKAEYEQTIFEIRREAESLSGAERSQFISEKSLEAERTLLERRKQILLNALKVQRMVARSQDALGIAAGTRIQQLIEQINNVDRLLDSRKPPVIFGDEDDAAENAQKKFESYFRSLELRLASTRGQLQETGSELEKFQTMADRGEFSLVDPQEVERLRQLAVGLDSAKAELKEMNDTAREMENLDIGVQRIVATVAGLNAKVDAADNPFRTMEAQAERSRATIKGLQEQISLMAMDASSSDAAQLQQFAEQLGKLEPEALAAARGLKAIEKANEDYAMSVATSGQRASIEFQRQLGYIEDFRVKFAEVLGPEAQAAIDQYIRNLDDMKNRAGNKLSELRDRWAEETQNVSGLFAEGVTMMADNLTEFIMTGKMDFKQFMADILRMIIQFMIKKMVVMFLDKFMPGAGAGLNIGVNQTNSAKGNVMTDRGPVALKKYARGGIATSPQLALFGEGSQPEAYVPLPDGRRIPVDLKTSSDMKENPATPGANVQVNVINQTQESVEAESSQPRFDGEQMIVDVVLKAMTRPGPLRETVRGTR